MEGTVNELNKSSSHRMNVGSENVLRKSDRYLIRESYIQMKRRGVLEHAVFDVSLANSC